MDNERGEYIRELFCQETNDPESRERRDDLTPEELEYIEQLDGRYESGIAALASAVLVREKVLERFRPEEIAEVEAIRDLCRVRLRDGAMYLAWLGRDRSLRLDEIDGVC